MEADGPPHRKRAAIQEPGFKCVEFANVLEYVRPHRMAEYTIICDESDQKGRFFSSFFGGVIVRTAEMEQATRILNEARAVAGIESEVKWSKVGPREAMCYPQLLDEYFRLIAGGTLKMRIMFRQNMHVAQNLSRDHRENEYFYLYYQFLKHGFGLPYMPVHREGVKIRFYLDQLSSQTKEQISQFRGFISGISRAPQLRALRLTIPEADIAEVDSKDHILLQCVDVVLGSMTFRLNDKHLAKAEGHTKRGRRTIAKEKLYKYILEKVRGVTKKPSFNPGISTGLSRFPQGRWSDPYLHWRFVPRDHRVDRSQTKP